MQIINFENSEGDIVPPDIDLNSLYVTARPVNSVEPDGETVVSVSIRASDDKSGIQWLSFCLKSQLDKYVRGSMSDSSFYQLVGTETPTQTREYTTVMTLSVGSTPGEWGLSSVGGMDRADNNIWHTLTELVQCRVFSPKESASTIYGIRIGDFCAL